MVVGCLWMILCAIHWEKLILLQYIISSIIFLGMVESITWYFDFLYYNHHANFHFSAILVGILSSTLKHTSSRVLVLVVSMGFGVVKLVSSLFLLPFPSSSLFPASLSLSLSPLLLPPPSSFLPFPSPFPFPLSLSLSPVPLPPPSSFHSPFPLPFPFPLPLLPLSFFCPTFPFPFPLLMDASHLLIVTNY